MPIDVTTVESDGWWLDRCVRKLQDPRRQFRLRLLDSYMRGDPPLPPEAEKQREALQAFIRLSRTNFAELVVRAPRERMRPVGVRTASASGDNGDLEAWSLWRAAGLPVEQAAVHETMLSLGDAYVIVGWDDQRNEPIVTAEDPRQVVTIHDPARQRRVLAGAKLFYDEITGRDLAYLYRPGYARVAFRQRKTATASRRGRIGWTPATWDWSDEVDGDAALGTVLPANMRDEMVLVRFRNRRGIGEFEHHRDLLDRINLTVLRRLVISAHQAHRQRALKPTEDASLPDVYPPDHPNAGQQIDYDNLFRSDPGAFWLLPPGVDVWESGQVDLSPILNSVKDDALHLAAVTATPLAMFTPDAATASAEGASFQREGLSYRTEDRIARADDGWAQTMRLMLLYAGKDARADLNQMSMIWAPVERHSLGEQGSAWSQMTDLPFAERARLILQASPDDIARMQAERTFDALLAPPPVAPPAPTA